MKREFHIIIGIIVLLLFLSAHLLYPFIGTYEFVFMGFSIGNLIVDLLIIMGIILQIYIITILSKRGS